METDGNKGSYPNRGRGRQLFIKGVSLLGLGIYVPAFLIVLLWPGLIAAGAKKLLINEVNERFEKIGGLASTVTEKAAGLKSKLYILKTENARTEQEKLETTSLISDNAERLIAHFVTERTNQITDSGKVPDSGEEPGPSITSEDSYTTSLVQTSPDEDSTTRSWASRLKDRVTSRAKNSAVADCLTSVTAFGAVIVSGIAGPGGILEELIKRPGIELKRLESAIYENYDSTLRELVRELRIFTGSNIIIFGLLWFAGGSPRRARNLFPLAVLLLATTVVISYTYVTSTNWIFAILHNSYMGWGYLAIVLGFFIYASHDVLFAKLLDLGSDKKNDD